MSNATNATFFTSRTAARAAVTDGVKFKDFGPSAPKGERWATVPTNAAALVASAPSITEPTKTRTPRTNSKKAAAVALIVKMLEKDAPRKDILAKLVDKVGLTAPGASTYYANVKSGLWTL